MFESTCRKIPTNWHIHAYIPTKYTHIHIHIHTYACFVPDGKGTTKGIVMICTALTLEVTLIGLETGLNTPSHENTMRDGPASPCTCDD